MNRKIVKNSMSKLDNSDKLTIITSLQQSRANIRRKIECLGQLISDQTKEKLYNDMYKYTEVINKLHNESDF